MKLEFRTNVNAPATIFSLLKNYEHVNYKELKVYGIHSGEYDKEEFEKALDKCLADFPTKRGNFVINAIFPESVSGAWLAFRKNMDKIAAEIIAEEFAKRCKETCTGFYFRFIPKDREDNLNPKETITRVFLIMD